MLPGPGENSSLNSTQITPSASIFFTFLSEPNVGSWF